MNRFEMGIEVRVKVLLFLFPVEDFYGFRVRPRVPRALPFLLLSLVFLFSSRIQPIWGSRVRVSVRFGSSHLFDSFLSFLLYRIILFPSSSRVRVRVLFSVPFSFPLLFFWILFWIFFSDLNGGLFFPRAVVVVTGSLVTSATPRSFFSFLLPS